MQNLQLHAENETEVQEVRGHHIYRCTYLKKKIVEAGSN